jgi:hypothetical protein
VHDVDDVGDRLHLAEALGVEPPPRQRLHADGELDGIDAVEIEILDDARLGLDPLGVEIEELDHGSAHLVEDLLPRRALHPGDPVYSRFKPRMER